jgi:succinyl-CoA synthetase beta subunit
VREKVLRIARSLLRVAQLHDCTTVEINPLAVLAGGSLMAADAKIVRDESAAFRNSGIAEAIRALNSHEPKLVERCLAAGLMLIRMEGNVGLISGGAGMTMATMDLIQAAGGRPACFLDCSASPTPKGYGLAFEMLDADPGVRSILVSIFGGATQMDRVARVMHDIMDERESEKPVVFRLNGTNAGAVQGIFDNAGIRNHVTLDAAVAEAVSLAGESA